MAKNVSVAMASHLLGEVTTLATCWKITRTDGVVKGFTDFDDDLVISGVTYEASSGYRRSAMEATDDFSVDNLEVEGVLGGTGLLDTDIKAGRYDFARVEVFLVNWADLTMGGIRLRTGTFGEASITNAGTFVVELRGIIQPLAQNFVEIYQPGCRASLGDEKCGVDADALSETGTVSSVTSRRVFDCTGLTEPDGYFAYGTVKWTSGDNEDLVMEVKGYVLATGGIELFMSMPYAIQIGDTFIAYPGCDGLRATCATKFNNAINFRGEPDLPGSDSTLAVAKEVI